MSLLMTYKFMKITNVTPRAIRLLAKLKKTGDLVDVYSEDFFKRQPAYDPKLKRGAGLFAASIFSRTEKQAMRRAAATMFGPPVPLFDFNFVPFHREGMENIERYMTCGSRKPKNHLLFIYGGLGPELRKELLKVYPPLKKMFHERWSGCYEPKFLLLNLYTQQMLCVGFGRNHRLFCVDATTETITTLGLDERTDSKYMAKIVAHDYYHAVRIFLNALQHLSYAMDGYDNLPCGTADLKDYLLPEMRDAGPAEDGLYYLPGVDPDPDSGDGHTLRQWKEFQKDWAHYDAVVNAAMKVINIFFPDCAQQECGPVRYYGGGSPN